MSRGKVYELNFRFANLKFENILLNFLKKNQYSNLQNANSILVFVDVV